MKKFLLINTAHNKEDNNTELVIEKNGVEIADNNDMFFYKGDIDNNAYFTSKYVANNLYQYSDNFGILIHNFNNNKRTGVKYSDYDYSDNTLRTFNSFVDMNLNAIDNSTIIIKLDDRDSFHTETDPIKNLSFGIVEIDYTLTDLNAKYGLNLSASEKYAYVLDKNPFNLEYLIKEEYSHVKLTIESGEITGVEASTDGNNYDVLMTDIKNPNHISSSSTTQQSSTNNGIMIFNSSQTIDLSYTNSDLTVQGIVLDNGERLTLSGDANITGDLTVTGEANINNQGTINLSGNLEAVTYEGGNIYSQTDYDGHYDAGRINGIASVNTSDFYNNGYSDGVASVDITADNQASFDAGRINGIASVNTSDYYNNGYSDGVASVDITADNQASFDAGVASVDIGTGVVLGELVFSLKELGDLTGNNLYNESWPNSSAKSVSLSSNGNILAVGGRYTGHPVKIFQRNDSATLGWTQIGQDIDGDYVSLSSNGNIVAIAYIAGNNSGRVRIYQRNDSATLGWTQKGQDIVGISDRYNTYPVSLSEDGNIVAIGEPNANGNMGYVRIFEYGGSSWQIRGDIIRGNDFDDYFGYAVSLSSSGNIVAVGTSYAEENLYNQGYVGIYEWDGSSWTNFGNFHGEEREDFLGSSVSLSADGTIIAIGAVMSDGNINTSDKCGHVEIHKWNGTSWEQRGNNIYGSKEGDQSGKSVSLSADGTIVAIGSTNHIPDGSGSSDYAYGYVKIYEWDGSTWNKKCEKIGDFSWAQVGNSLSLSSNGSIVAIGTSKRDVYVYELEELYKIVDTININNQGTINLSGNLEGVTYDGIDIISYITSLP